MMAALYNWADGLYRVHFPAESLRRRFAHSVIWSMAGAFLARGANLAAAVVCARILGEKPFGELGMIQSTVAMFGTFASLGLGLTASRYVAEFRQRDHVRVGRILALSAVLAMGSGLLAAGGLAWVAPKLAVGTLHASHLAEPIAIAAGLVLFGSLNGAAIGALQGFEAFSTVARVNAWSGIATFLLVGLGVWRGGLRGAVWALVAALAVQWWMNRQALSRECEKNQIVYDWKNWKQEWRVLFQFSLPALIASAVVGPAMWICNAILIQQPDGYSQLGLYIAADRWRLMILFLPSSAIGMAVPLLSNLQGAGNAAGFRKVIRANIGVSLLSTVGPGLVVALLAVPIMSLYGQNFRAGWIILVVLVASAVPEALNVVLGHPLLIKNSMWLRCGFDLFLAVVLVVLALVLIPRWGAVGLAAAYCLTFTATSLGLFAVVRKDVSREGRTNGAG